MPDEELVQFNVTIESSLYEAIKRRAEDEERTLTVVARRALRRYLEDDTELAS